MEGWSDLPDVVLLLILTNLCSLVDFLSFSAVCKSWRAVASSISPSQTSSLFPPLLLCPTFSPGSERLSSLLLYDPATPSFSHSLQRFSNKFKSIYCGMLSCSYSHGCLIRMSLKNEVLILNPFTGHEIRSPVIPSNCFLPCPVLTSPLSSPDSAVLLLSRGSLFYWRTCEPSWCSCEGISGITSFLSVAIVQGKVYVKKDHTLFVLHLTPELHLTQLADEGIPESSAGYLVECGGELFSLQLVITTEDLSARFEVFGLETSRNGTRWVKKETLGHWAFFVGIDPRAAGIAVENPERWGGRSHCVYFPTGNAGREESPWIVVKLGEEVDPWDSDSAFGKDWSKLSPVWLPRGF